MYPEDDHMVLEGSGLIPVRDGFVDETSGNFITTEGVVYDSDGELLYDPFDEEDVGGGD